MAEDTSRQSLLPLILSTFLVAYILTRFSYPDWIKYATPDWVFMVLFYWCLAIPERVGTASGWVAGLLLDVLNYSVLGQHAIAMAFVALVVVSTHRRIRLYSLWQQCLVVFVLSAVTIGIKLWVYNLAYGNEYQLAYWQAALTTSLVWPVFYGLMRYLKKWVR